MAAVAWWRTPPILLSRPAERASGRDMRQGSDRSTFGSRRNQSNQALDIMMSAAVGCVDA